MPSKESVLIVFPRQDDARKPKHEPKRGKDGRFVRSRDDEPTDAEQKK